jgi:hypothetical protein
MIKVLNKMKEMVPVVFDDFKEIKIDEKGIPYYE